MIDPTVDLYWFESALYKRYLFNFGDHRVLFLSRVDPQTKHALGMMSAIIQEHVAQILAVMKQPTLGEKGTQAFWREFQVSCKTVGAAKQLWAEMPQELAAHYLETYPGLSMSHRSGSHGLVVLECNLEESNAA